jgi:predicted phosphodiesterase
VRIFAISDLHVDYPENRRWLDNVSRLDYQNDLLIVAGDVTDTLHLLAQSLSALRNRFSEVLFIPGNHDLWVVRSKLGNSLDQLNQIKAITRDCGVRMEPYHRSHLSIVPLYGWYDYSFGSPDAMLLNTWADYSACKWPDGSDALGITRFFLDLNDAWIANCKTAANQLVISFSHFLPRIDLMPSFIPDARKSLYAVLGTSLLESQIRQLGSKIHVYGHSHVNNQVRKDQTLYLNNAFGYPHETMITRKVLKCIHEI